jgi:LmbE family N-acetylglucosaminyl deacetylase
MRIPSLAAIPLLLFAALGAAAQDDAAEIRQALLALSHDGVLMDLSAHPDDEDGASLAMYRMRYGVRTYSVLFTRGEGGQNEKGPELYEDLGLLRSLETESAGRILGAEVHFLNLLDFGYSKTASEAFRKWGGQQEVLRRLVYVIRLLKPDVLFTNHNTIDGHGHHQAVAITALAAFDAAADSSYFPEQLREPGVSLWQPRKMFFRAFGRFEPAAEVANRINDTDPARGVTYLDIAAEALHEHKTQGLDRANLRSFTRGKNLYRLVRANSLYDADSTSFFSGINHFHDPTTRPLLPVRALIDRLRPSLPSDSMLAIASSVFAACDSLRASGRLSILADRMLAHWETEAGELAARICGVTARCTLRDSVVVRRQRVPCELVVHSSRCAPGSVRWSFALPQGWTMEEDAGAPPDSRRDLDRKHFMLTVGDDARLTLPGTVTQYRSLEHREELMGRVSVTLNGRRVMLMVRPGIEVAPARLIEVTPRSAGVLRTRVRSGISLAYAVRNYLPHKTAGRIAITAPAGWSGDHASFVIEKEDSVARGRLTVRPPDGVPPGEYVIRVESGEASEAVVISVIDANVAPGVTPGIVKSYDTTLESAAATLGVGYALVSDDDLARGDLGRFSTIVIDIRAYLVREALRNHNERLLAYVRAGGNLVVMYQREAEWKPAYAPAPFQITRRRVCEEEAPVTILAPDHPLLRVPNAIGENDWRGWKQERAVYVPGDVPADYVRLLSTGDPDEPPLSTAYLVANAGNGTYIYTSLVWYRQLKDGNAGAFRCFANMLSYRAGRPSRP